MIYTSNFRFVLDLLFIGIQIKSNRLGQDLRNLLIKSPVA
jgi:hypothetical protein